MGVFFILFILALCVAVAFTSFAGVAYVSLFLLFVAGAVVFALRPFVAVADVLQLSFGENCFMGLFVGACAIHTLICARLAYWAKTRRIGRIFTQR